ncbi:hypothetical protein DSAG12_02009 [Promethearchaeum syntrophicum]|uniref:Uncharacterized protein n=1 Tax=Promethearchaeum syntrophicum TaxID=2594042 RepID=A0A5B9DBQ3_9ARCH|nr:hypothetical protein [Candidatus Prometheoarchaeum syntrophicum]QEE16180.1 hypothetical protein DSAG12_02009 [Candidatus Prometheoarchaeum syntrophicum]
MKDEIKQKMILIYYINGIIFATIFFFVFKNIFLPAAIVVSVFIAVIFTSMGWGIFYLNTYFKINHHHQKPNLLMVLLSSFIYLIPAGIICYNIFTKKYSNIIANFQKGNTKYKKQITTNGIKCQKCNNFNIGNGNFCIQCGYKLK